MNDNRPDPRCFATAEVVAYTQRELVTKGEQLKKIGEELYPDVQSAVANTITPYSLVFAIDDPASTNVLGRKKIHGSRQVTGVTRGYNSLPVSVSLKFVGIVMDTDAAVMMAVIAGGQFKVAFRSSTGKGAPTGSRVMFRKPTKTAGGNYPTSPFGLIPPDMYVESNEVNTKGVAAEVAGLVAKPVSGEPAESDEKSFLVPVVAPKTTSKATVMSVLDKYIARGENGKAMEAFKLLAAGMDSKDALVVANAYGERFYQKERPRHLVVIKGSDSVITGFLNEIEVVITS
jgi:hypothetical protein